MNRYITSYRLNHKINLKFQVQAMPGHAMLYMDNSAIWNNKSLN